MKRSFLNQSEIISILGGVFVLNGLATEGWILLSLGIFGSFVKFAMIFQSVSQKEEKRLLTESEKSINELSERLAAISSK